MRCVPCISGQQGQQNLRTHIDPPQVRPLHDQFDVAHARDSQGFIVLHQISHEADNVWDENDIHQWAPQDQSDLAAKARLAQLPQLLHDQIHAKVCVECCQITEGIGIESAPSSMECFGTS